MHMTQTVKAFRGTLNIFEKALKNIVPFILRE